jgi:tetratricopeptide (TPR) repeat protein
MVMVAKWSGREAQALRMARRMSLRAFAAHLGVARGSVVNWEQRGELARLRPETQEILDRDLSLADDTTRERFEVALAGSPTSAVPATTSGGTPAGDAGRPLVASVHDPVHLLVAADEQAELSDVDSGVRKLAIAYLGSPPLPMLQQAVDLRSETLRRLRQHQYRPHETADLYLTLGRVQGVMAYAALDLGDAQAAAAHADTAWACAERAGDNELRVWARGTQSLIARFAGDYDRAMGYVLDGLKFKTSGTGHLRLLCGYAQCHANLGDPRGTNDALNLALDEREKLSTVDSFRGIFEFSEAKQRYYAGSSLIWLDGGPDAARAAREAGEAISIWQRQPADARALDDEALAHVYQGTAYLQLDELGAAAAAIRPILDLPAEQQISWMRKRLARFAGMLRSKRYADASEARELYDKIQALAA